MSLSGIQGKIAVLVVLGLLSACAKKYYPEITSQDIRETVNYLASDELGGRKPGEKGDSLAAEFIRGKFMNAGLKMLYNNGFQPFSLIASVTLGANNQASFNGENYVAGKDFLPYSFSQNGSFTGGIVFAGYGFDIQKDSLKWNDYAGIEVAGKWVLLLKGDPEIDKTESVFEEYANERIKVLTATDHRAAGVVLVGGPHYSEKDQLEGLFYDKNSSTYTIPVIQVTREVVDRWLIPAGTSVAKLEEQLNLQRRPASFALSGELQARVEVVQQQVQSNNVVALLPGTDKKLKNEYVVVGAHFDHLGMGGPGSGSRLPDTVAVHNGADDNASGVAAVIELAEKAASLRQNRRGIIFAAFGAEEMGLVGSKAFVEQPPVKTDQLKAMFNFDMIGRLDDSSNILSISGTQTSKEAETILKKNNPGFELALSGDGYGPSDHASFYMQNIPVFFVSTGAHGDYHTPADDADRINYEGARKVTEYAWSLLQEVASRDSSLTYQEAGAKIKRGRGGRFKVTLGIMPDYAGLEKRGMRIDAVTKGKPAEKAGMQKGDIITAIDGKKVGNIYDYMNRLQALEAGKTISVDIIRDGKEMVLIVQL